MLQEHTNVISLTNVSFAYREAPVLEDVTLEVARGEICALIGDNGAGKSTLVRLVIGEFVPSSGSAKLFGTPAAKFKNWELVGYVPQIPAEATNRFPASVLELVDASQYARAKTEHVSSKERRRRSLEALELVGMRTFTTRIIRELSGGQLQRVRLACALVSNPELLILDEPTTGLDKDSRDHFYALVREAHAARNLAVLLITHDMAALDALACRVVEVSDCHVHEVAGRGHGANHCALHGSDCQGTHVRGEVLLDDFDESYALPEDIEHTGGIKHV